MFSIGICVVSSPELEAQELFCSVSGLPIELADDFETTVQLPGDIRLTSFWKVVSLSSGPDRTCSVRLRASGGTYTDEATGVTRQLHSILTDTEVFASVVAGSGTATEISFGAYSFSALYVNEIDLGDIVAVTIDSVESRWVCDLNGGLSGQETFDRVVLGSTEIETEIVALSLTGSHLHVGTALGGQRQVPGDCNQDGMTDLSDGLCALGFLFIGDPALLPCGDGSIGANLLLLDWNNDGLVDLTDAIAMLKRLFLGAV